MITKDELYKVNELEDMRGNFEELLRSFDCKYIWTKVGIVSINSAAQSEPQKNEHAQFFYNEMKPLVEEMTKKTIAAIKHKIKEIDLEISKYIKPVKEG